MKGKILFAVVMMAGMVFADGADTVFNVRDFGAKGDGKSSDTEACKKALAAAAECSGTVYFPAGRYRIHDLKIPEGVSLKADPKWLFRSSLQGAVLDLDDPSARCAIDITGAYGVRLTGLLVNCSIQTDHPVHGIMLDNPTKYSPKEDSPVIEDCKVQGFSGDGIHLNRVWCFFIRHSMSAFNLGNGVFLRGWDGFVIDNQFSGNHGHGFVTTTDGSTVMFTSNRIEWNRKCGLMVAPGWGNSWNITGNAFDRNFRANIVMENTQGSTVSGNLLRRAGRDPDAEMPAEDVSCQMKMKNCRGIAVIGNTLEAGWDDNHIGELSPVAGFILEKLECCTVRGNTMFGGYAKEAIIDRGGHGELVLADNLGKPMMPDKGIDVFPEDKSAWMRRKAGIFTHYLLDANTIKCADDFDVQGLVNQLKRARCNYFILTLGQNSGYFCSPNSVFEKIGGFKPGERTTKRDIPAEIIAALKGSNIRFGLYLPCQPPNRDAETAVRYGFAREGNSNGWGDRDFTEQGVDNWARTIEEWSRRYGEGVKLWWFDGAYPHLGMSDAIAAKYKAAALTGNPKAIVSFNAGVKGKSAERQSDYWAGEENEPFGVTPANRWHEPGVQWQVLTYLGKTWGEGSIRSNENDWRKWLHETLGKGGAVTIDMHIDVKTGHLDPDQSDFFHKIRWR